MATVARLLPSSCYPSSIFSHNNASFQSSCTFLHPKSSKTRVSSLKLQSDDQGYVIKDMDGILDFEGIEKGQKIQEIHCMEEYDRGIKISHEKLVIAHFSANHYKYNSRIQRFMEEQCRLSNEVKFLYVMADESEKTRPLCRREHIENIPYFAFYEKTEKIHEEAGFQPENLARSILYYVDDPFSPVVQLKSGKDLAKLIEVQKLDQKLIVVNVGMRQCFPCVKIYPSVVKLASQFSRRVVFARMNVDENDECMQISREMEVSKVPAFLFVKNGEICGRYVGSSASVLIREIQKSLANQLITERITLLTTL